METLEEQISQLAISKSTLTNKASCNDYGATEKQQPSLTIQSKTDQINTNFGYRNLAPSIPPKPLKTLQDIPQVPQSKLVSDTREPLYSQPLYGLGFHKTTSKSIPSGCIIFRKPICGTKIFEKSNSSCKVTLDNPDVLEQQLEALAYHKLQLEKRGLLGSKKQSRHFINNIPKLSSTSLCGNKQSGLFHKNPDIFENTNDLEGPPLKYPSGSTNLEDDFGILYSNIKIKANEKIPNNSTSSDDFECNKEIDENLTSPPSPVSSSYSELRRTMDIFEKPSGLEENVALIQPNKKLSSVHKDYVKQHSSSQLQTNKTSYFGYGSFSQSSSTYDSIYEPINPRPSSAISSRSNYNLYASYVNETNFPSSSTSANISTLGNINSSGANTPTYCGGAIGDVDAEQRMYQKDITAGNLDDYLTASLDPLDIENYGRCYKCNERILGENSGCTAMEKVYHVTCFTCSVCQINLQGKPFYALEGKPYCEYDYLQTLEKCSVCMKPILERILRATGKPYHPQCFTCVVCGNSLDGIPFTVDATNQNYCITDFHKKFAPRCCVCKNPIMPEHGQEETVRVVALDRSFHLECYKCEDCGLLLSSEADGRGCYPLDDHVLCKSCNAQRVQVLTKHMGLEL